MTKKDARPTTSEVLIAGAGIIGLALALELASRGAQVAVAERAPAGTRTDGQASWAAAGMLAADDPHHPPELRPLARRSIALYNTFLERIADLGGLPVRYQTGLTVEHASDGGRRELQEQSLDPRELMQALEAAVQAAGVVVHRGFRAERAREDAHGAALAADDGRELGAGRIVWAQGAWMGAPAGVRPMKGQMLRVHWPRDAGEAIVHRAGDVYLVPRTHGAQAGTALIGATVEDAGFDTTVRAGVLDDLRARAARLAPAVADAPAVEAWAGLRPATASGLPWMGAMPGSARQYVACGHFRNGVLLAPGTAALMADLLEGRGDAGALAPFAVRGKAG